MKLKSILLMCLSFVVVAAVAIGGTLAYLTSTDDDVNVMTLGNVKIEQIEQERDENGNLVDFTQNKPAYPAVGPVEWDDEGVMINGTEYKVFTDDLKNVVDKIVTVKNTGKSDAYVRTIVAIEAPDYDPNDLIHINYNITGVTISSPVLVEMDGTEYVVFTFTYTEPVKAGEASPPSLLQVFLDSATTNEDCEKFGDTWEILVVSQAVQTAGFDNAEEALNAGFGTPTDVALCADWFGAAIANYEASLIDTWDGTTDTTWYNDTDTEFTLTTAEQLAGLGKLVDDGNTFAGKTVKLGIDMDLYCLDDNGDRVCFDPIGDASTADFSGIFDGNNKTIYNLYQDCNSKHLALFGAVYEGTVKNLTLDGARIENDGTGYAGGIASYAGASTFEKITLRNTTVVNYNHNTGGIVAWCSNNGTTTTFDGINIENTTTIGSWWGSYDTRVGGVVGAMNTGNNVVIKNSTIACRLDVYNDVTSNYQWYNYRTAGMVVADVRDTQTIDGRTQANPARVTCENVEVIFGDWANYHYCESADYGTPSYADEGEYKFRRVESGLGYGGIDITTCNHAADETHNELIAFDFLFGARDGKGIYGISAFDGVTVK